MLLSSPRMGLADAANTGRFDIAYLADRPAIFPQRPHRHNSLCSRLYTDLGSMVRIIVGCGKGRAITPHRELVATGEPPSRTTAGVECTDRGRARVRQAVWKVDFRDQLGAATRCYGARRSNGPRELDTEYS